MKPDKAENDKKEGNAYDKIFKENIESVFLPLMHKYLGINIASLEVIEPKLQTTLELEADFLRLVKTLIIRSIINKLRKTSKSEAELNKFIKQLGMLSRLRNLEKETRQTITAMPITYDIQNDGLYKEGLEKGAALEAKKQEEKQQKEKEQIIISLLKIKNISTSKIASICKVSQSLVRKLKTTLEKE